MAKEADEILKNYLRKLGQKGGQARAKRHSKKQLQEWARLGGRPRKEDKPRTGSGRRGK